MNILGFIKNRKVDIEASHRAGLEAAKSCHSELVSESSTGKAAAKKKAFTLAEVLITLGIIGVVAALTIPALMQNTNNKELVSGTLKMGTTLSNGLKTMEALDLTNVQKLPDLDTFKANFIEHLKTVNCTEHDVCLADGGYFDYANDGFGGACDKTSPCVEINADINGKKGPNKEGKDRYTFLVTDRGIIPKGEANTCSGLDCTSYVIAHHKLWDGETSITNDVDNSVLSNSCNSELYFETTTNMNSCVSNKTLEQLEEDIGFEFGADCSSENLVVCADGGASSPICCKNGKWLSGFGGCGGCTQ